MRSFVRRGVCAITGLALGGLGCGDNLLPVPGAPRLRFEPIVLEGGAPQAITELAFVPGTDDFLVLGKARTVTHYRLDAATDHAARLGAFDVPGVDDSADCGLLSVAFDPDFATNRLVYFAACTSVRGSRITRHVLELDDPAAIAATIAATTTTVIEVGLDSATRGWHNIGSIGFHDGYLWALFGDKDDPVAAQDPQTNLGAVVRIAPDRAAPGYAPAPGNPFAGIPDHSPDLAAIGLRSPWRGAVDHAGRLWIGDVGDTEFEEVNVSRFAGENFGAGLVEGPCTSGCGGFREPITSWDRSAEHRYAREDPQVSLTSRRSVWVGIEYPRATPIDRYDGRLFDKMLVGDFCTGWIRAIALDAADAVVSDEPAGHLEAASSWALGPDGHLYVSSYGSCFASPYPDGAIYRAVLAR